MEEQQFDPNIEKDVDDENYHVYSAQEVEYLKNTATMGLPNRNIGRALWFRAFKTYNKFNSPPVGMGCSPCYVKVALYIIKISEKHLNNQSNG